MDDDYIKTLSDEEKVIFVEIFCALIRADGRIDHEELAFLDALGKRYGLERSTISGLIQKSADLDAVFEASHITDRQKALELIKELLVLANIDDEIVTTELELIVNVAHAMNIEDDKIRAINRWVLDTKMLVRAGQVIMEK